MKQTFLILTIMAITFVGVASALADNKIPDDPKFFCHADVQKTAEKAFAVQEASIPFLQLQSIQIEQDAHQLVKALRSDEVLLQAITDFEKLSLDQKIELMKKIFVLQVRTLGITPPTLVLDNNFQNATYFDFDVEHPDPGHVILNPKALSEMDNPYAPLLFLIHETKHSAQFQLAFSTQVGKAPPELIQGYREAFLAQKRLAGKLSFCDFLTLLNEYDAFQYGNLVLAQLTNGKSNDMTMGTFASQFNDQGFLKIDLLDLFQNVGPQKFFDAFNELEIPQWKALSKSETNSKMEK